jgi:protein dithiol oxidoreductase (disulfide-forming)
MSMFRTALALLTLLALPVAHADLTEGTDFRRLAKPLATEHPGKVEVVEFFSYGCPHCFQAYRPIEKWSQQLPANVAFVRIPLSLGRREWGALSRTYYALHELGQFARLDAKLFEAIHVDGQPLFDEEGITLWMSKQGIPADKFRAAYNSSAVSAKVMRAEELSRGYGVSSVPTFAVDGRYVVTAEKATTFPEVLDLTRQVMVKASQEPARK